MSDPYADALSKAIAENAKGYNLDRIRIDPYTPEQQKMISDLMKMQNTAAAPKPIQPVFPMPQRDRPKLSIIDATAAYRQARTVATEAGALVKELKQKLRAAEDALDEASRKYQNAEENLLRTAADEDAEIL